MSVKPHRRALGPQAAREVRGLGVRSGSMLAQFVLTGWSRGVGRFRGRHGAAHAARFPSPVTLRRGCRVPVLRFLRPLSDLHSLSLSLSCMLAGENISRLSAFCSWHERAPTRDRSSATTRLPQADPLTASVILVARPARRRIDHPKPPGCKVHDQAGVSADINEPARCCQAGAAG